MTKGARRVAVACALACAASVAAACGSGEPDTPDPGPEEASFAPDGIHGRAPAAVGGIPAIVTLTPTGADEGMSVDGSAPGALPGKDEAVIDQFGLAFSPRVLVVATGTVVTFTNSEGALTHNVHARSVETDSTLFNGDAASGEVIRVEFTDEGGYDILCDMHPGMTAFVFATRAPYATLANNDGTFDTGPLPPGSYAVRSWSVETGFGEELSVSAGAGGAEVDLTSGT